MIVDVALNPRVAQLLGRIEETRRLAQDHPEGHVARVALDSRIEGFYAELGRYVHWLVRQDPAALARLAEEGRRWADELGEKIRYELIPEVSSAEVEIDLPDDESVEMSASEMPMVELTGDSRVDAVDVRDLVDVEPDGPADEGAEEEQATEPEPVAFADVADLEEVTDVEEVPTAPSEDRHIAVRTGTFEIPNERVADAEGGRAHDEGEWVGPLRDLLATLGAPDAVTADRAGRATTVRSIAIATTNLETRWAVFPQPVQQALLGFVGARARRLDEELASDPDVRLAMSRMRRFAETKGLGLVPALREGAGLTRNWAADERRYWTVLHAGV